MQNPRPTPSLRHPRDYRILARQDTGRGWTRDRISLALPNSTRRMSWRLCRLKHSIPRPRDYQHRAGSCCFCRIRRPDASGTAAGSVPYSWCDPAPDVVVRVARIVAVLRKPLPHQRRFQILIRGLRKRRPRQGGIPHPTRTHHHHRRNSFDNSSKRQFDARPARRNRRGR